jgi:hypothetical protein
MKMNSPTIDIEQSGVIKQSFFSIKDKNLGVMFDIARKKIYTNKPLAIIREYCTNAYDAHVEAGISDKPIEVIFPTPFNNTLTIRDFGYGLSEEFMLNDYVSYAESSKRDTNDQVGMLGLGCKSAFCYVNDFLITSYHDGTKSLYKAFIDDTRLGVIAKMYEEPTTETGLEITIAINPDDLYSFKTTAGEFLAEFKPQPIVRNDDFVVRRMQDTHKKSFLINKDAYSIHNSWHENNHVVRMGNVNYAFKLSDLSLNADDAKELSPFQSNYIKLYAEIGTVTPAASREYLEMDERTKSFLVSQMKQILDDIKSDVQSEIDKCKSLYLFDKTFCELFATIRAFNISVDFQGETYSSRRSWNIQLKKYEMLKEALRISRNLNNNTSYKVISDLSHNEDQIIFTYHENVNKTSVRPRISQSSYNLDNAFLFKFENQASRDEFVNHPDWQGATFVDVASLRFDKTIKTRVSRTMVKSDVYRFMPHRTSASQSWIDEKLSLGVSEGIYVEINRFNPKMRYPDGSKIVDVNDLNQLLNNAYTLGIRVDTVYGIKSADLKKLGSGWVSLNDHIKQQIDEMTSEKIALVNKCKISDDIKCIWLDYYRRGMQCSNDREEQLKQILLDNYSTDTMTTLKMQALRFFVYRDYKFDFHLYDLCKELINETLDNHPMLKNVFEYNDLVFSKIKYMDVLNDYVMGR